MLPADRSFRILPEYKNFYSATINGVVRLDSETAPTIDGLSTFSLRSCIGLVLHHTGTGKMSLAHMKPGRTNVSQCVSGELQWMGDTASVTASVVQDEQCLLGLASNASATQEVNVAVAELRAALLHGGVCESKISMVNTKNGAVAARRDSRELIIPQQEDLGMTDVIGTPCPYITLRQAIHSLPIVSPSDIDVQFDAVGWTAVKDIEAYGCVLSEEHLKQHYHPRDNTLATLKEKLSCEPHLKDLGQQTAPWDSWAAGIVSFLLAKENFDKSCITYKLFSLDEDQSRMVRSIGGRVENSSAPGVHVVRIPTRYLVGRVRSVLKLERMRLKGCPFNSETKRAHLDYSIVGWRGEVDFEKENHVLITFPYRDETHRLELRAALAKILN